MPDHRKIIKIQDGTEIRVRGLRWDDGWEFDCPVVIISPVLRVYEDGRSLDNALEDLCIDACVDGQLVGKEGTYWRWDWAKSGAMAYLKRKYYRKGTQRLDEGTQRLDVRVRFVIDDDDGELTWEVKNLAELSKSSIEEER